MFLTELHDRELRNRKSIAWLGTPGIGKSAGLNYVLMEFLQHLGEDGWPDTLLYRNPEEVFVFTMDDESTRQVF